MAMSSCTLSTVVGASVSRITFNFMRKDETYSRFLWKVVRRSNKGRSWMRFWLWRRAKVYQNLFSLRLASWHRFSASSSATIRFVVPHIWYKRLYSEQSTISHPRSQRRCCANCFSLLPSFERTSSPGMAFTPICPQRMMNWMTRGTSVHGHHRHTYRQRQDLPACYGCTTGVLVSTEFLLSLPTPTPTLGSKELFASRTTTRT